MSRREFLEDVNDIYDLKNVVYDAEIDALEDVYDYDGMDWYLNEYLTDIARYRDWEDMKDYLNRVPTYTDGYYERYDGDEWEPYDEDRRFADDKQEVYEILCNCNFFEDDDEEEEKEESSTYDYSIDEEYLADDPVEEEQQIDIVRFISRDDNDEEDEEDEDFVVI